MREYFIVDPHYRNISVFRLDNGCCTQVAVVNEDETLASVVLPELELDLRKVFESIIRE